MTSCPERIGPYPIERELGRGGMGIVYLGRDPELGRAVAVKVLPDALADDPERLARFDREARMLAAVHHPNVASIFGVGRDAEGRRYLALEYVPGESLAARLDRAPLPLAEALDVCRQIATGLETAHEAGVVHRDLKPANVRLTPDGAVKVLDFGLAKGVSSEPSLSSTFAASPTRTYLYDTTERGVVLGTLTYMSPEQANGKPVDRRTDIWALGCILFECLSGRAPFAANTPNEALVAILEHEPPWESLPAATPPRVLELLRRTLAKDRKDRLRDAGDARLELAAAQAERASDRRPPAARRSWMPRLGPSLRLLAAAVVGTVLGWWLADTDGGTRAPLTQLSLAVPDLILGNTDLVASGRELVLQARPRGTPSSEDRLYRRTLDNPHPVPIAGTERAKWFRLLGDGRVFFVAGKAGSENAVQAYVVAVDGSAPPTALFSTHEDWLDAIALPDGRFLVLADRGRVFKRVEPGRGEVESVAIRADRPATFTAILSNELLDGRFALLYFGRYTGGGFVQGTATLDVTTGQAMTVLEDGRLRAITGDGFALFTRGQTLFAAPFDAAQRRILPPEVSLLSGLRVFETDSAAPFDYANGTLIYPSGGEAMAARQLVACTPGGSCEEWTPARRPFLAFGMLRRDGDGVLATLANAVDNYEIWRFGHDGSAQPVVALRGRDVGGGARSPDGRRVAYFLEDAGKGDEGLYVTDGGAAPVHVVDGEGGRRPLPIAWQPDGNGIVTDSRRRSERQHDILLADPQTPGKVAALLATSADERPRALSPDGRHLAYSSDVTGHPELYLAELRADHSLGAPVLLSHAEVASAAFAPDGRAIYFTAEPRVLRLRLQADGLPHGASPEAVLDLGIERLLQPFAVLADGRLLFFRRGPGEDADPSVEVVLGFDAEVRRRVEAAR